ncbi:hypothetical protein MAR_033405 [Mya arenaria]|uniref:Uncharacterized protein n=1 Tax=Mya arenaria TaxID=6604 RepID=A0ABY7GC90_MYAAR|nr:hypothetical protein MAR_033405 [Mya arenaria]
MEEIKVGTSVEVVAVLGVVGEEGLIRVLVIGVEGEEEQVVGDSAGVGEIEEGEGPAGAVGVAVEEEEGDLEVVEFEKFKDFLKRDTARVNNIQCIEMGCNSLGLNLKTDYSVEELPRVYNRACLERQLKMCGTHTFQEGSGQPVNQTVSEIITLVDKSLVGINRLSGGLEKLRQHLQFSNNQPDNVISRLEQGISASKCGIVHMFKNNEIRDAKGGLTHEGEFIVDVEEDDEENLMQNEAVVTGVSQGNLDGPPPIVKPSLAEASLLVRMKNLIYYVSQSSYSRNNMFMIDNTITNSPLVIRFEEKGALNIYTESNAPALEAEGFDPKNASCSIGDMIVKQDDPSVWIPFVTIKSEADTLERTAGTPTQPDRTFIFEAIRKRIDSSFPSKDGNELVFGPGVSDIDKNQISAYVKSRNIKFEDRCFHGEMYFSIYGRPNLRDIAFALQNKPPGTVIGRYRLIPLDQLPKFSDIVATKPPAVSVPIKQESFTYY